MTHRLSNSIFVTTLSLAVAFASNLPAGDWPTWRFDAARSAASPDALPAELHLQWQLDLPKPDPAWPADQTKLQFDGSYEPVAAGDRLFVPSMVRGSVTAYDTRTGERRWRYYANGPVRFAPVVHQDKLYFTADDGYLYCLTAADGRLVWKAAGQPNRRWLLGNDRFISAWPARTGPVLLDGTVYFTAGIWPFMGVYVHAVDAESGKRVWTNSGTGANYVVQQHNSPAFAGVAPQGYLAAGPDRLLVAGGRTVPAGFDRRTGKLLYFDPANRNYGKDIGGYDVVLAGDWYCNHGTMHSIETGNPFTKASVAIVSGERMFALAGNKLVVYPVQPTEQSGSQTDRRGQPVNTKQVRFDPLMQATLPSQVKRLLIRAGDRLYGTDGAGGLFAVAVPQQDSQQAKIVWQSRIHGGVWNMLAADDRLFVVSREGAVYCFGADDQGLDLKPDPAGPQTLVANGAVWKYLDDGSDQQQAWRAADFDDSAWASGPAELGYGDDDEATTVGFGGKPKQKFITTYFRHTFELPDGATIAELQLNTKVDDGAVFYLNGREAARIFMPDGAVEHRTQAQKIQDENKIHQRSIDATLLRPGRNVLAAEVHQAGPSSSDISLAVELTGVAAAPEPEAVSSGGESPAVTSGGPAGAILQRTGKTEGYCLVLGLRSVSLLAGLAQQSDLHVIALDPNADRVAAARRNLDDADLLGRRVEVIQGDLETITLPNYLASLIVVTEPGGFGLDRPQFLKRVFETLRPYGGVALLPSNEETQSELTQLAADGSLPGATITHASGYALLRRPNALPNAGSWTHQSGNVANTLVSTDKHVRLPLGVLWFGGPSNRGVLPRHGHGPEPQIAAGRLVIEGRHMLRAVDVYDGRLLWQRDLPDLGLFYDNTAHQAGANAIGSNYVTLPDAVYVAYGRQGLRLDPVTGETVATFALPPDATGKPAQWGYIGVYDDLLIAGATPIAPLANNAWADKESIRARYAEGSSRLVVMDRHSGQVLWQRKATLNFRHNAIVAGAGKVFCIDRMTPQRLAYLKRRGEQLDGEATLYALDAKTGDVVWERSENVFGTWLGLSEQHGLLLQAGSSNRDRAGDETGRGMAVHRVATGDVAWHSDQAYGGPCMIHGSTIFTQGGAVNLLTGRTRGRRHPLTDQMIPWSFTRNYGCNTAIGCTNLITFRSAMAGYFDLRGDSGTGNWGGFRSSCTSNLIAADGVLNAPDYTRTCTCSYQIQTSLALVHMPEVETWTFNSLKWDGQRVRRVGVNFGAPGDHRDAQGTLWMDWPSVGGPSPDLPIEVDGQQVEYVRQHASWMHGGESSWVAASGVRGARTIRIPLSRAAEAPPAKYTVRLLFAQHDATGGAPLDVTLQGKPVLEQFDVVAEAGGVRRGVAKQFAAVEIADALQIELAGPGAATALLCGVEIIIEP